MNILVKLEYAWHMVYALESLQCLPYGDIICSNPQWYEYVNSLIPLNLLFCALYWCQLFVHTRQQFINKTTRNTIYDIISRRTLCINYRLINNYYYYLMWQAPKMANDEYYYVRLKQIFRVKHAFCVCVFRNITSQMNFFGISWTRNIKSFHSTTCRIALSRNSVSIFIRIHMYNIHTSHAIARFIHSSEKWRNSHSIDCSNVYL